MGIVEKFPLRSLRVDSFRFLSRQWRDLQVFSTRASAMALSHLLRTIFPRSFACAPRGFAFDSSDLRQKCFA
jgi:hypothetical protein